jgi:hypothetical protein
VAKRAKFVVDTSEVTILTSAMEGLQARMTTDRHLGAVTRAAFETLNDKFNQDTHTAAQGNPLSLHHVYEWDHIGIPGFQLWKTKLNGRGGERTVTWDWRASKTTVPTTTNPDGTPRFRQQKGFDESRLRRVHVFVWKAPMMEYGTPVTVRPKNTRYLVFPNNSLQGGSRRSRGPGVVTFTEHLVHFVPGGDVKGNFTTWFKTWWGAGPAADALEGIFDRKRDNAFKASFEARMHEAIGTGSRHRKTISFGIDTAAASKGNNYAKLIAGDMERFYHLQARARRDNFGGDDE